MREPRAELTIFFALVTAVIFALFLSILESARTEAARLHLTIAANSSIDSLFSQYHLQLWKDYRLLGLEQYAYDQLSDEMSDFIEPYFSADDWMPMELDTIEIVSAVGLGDENGAIFEEEVLDYMKYGILVSIWELADIELFDSGVTEGSSVEIISDLYDDHAAEAARIEEALEDIASLLQQLAADVSDALSAAREQEGSEVVRRLRSAVDGLSDLPGLIDRYEELADSLAQELEISRAELEAKKAAGEISDTTMTLLNEDISSYESYVVSDGERRLEISAFRERAASDISFFDDVIEEAYDIMEYIANWEPDDEDDELDEEELWSPVVRKLSDYDPMSIASQYGIADEEKLGKLESLKALFSTEILKLVLPEGASVGSENFDLSDAPSTCMSSGIDENRLGIPDKLYVAEYMSRVLSYFGRGVYDDAATKGSLECEQEYVICGEASPAENLTKVVERLILIRSGLNLIYLYSDSTKRSEARDLALAVTGAFALTPLTAVVNFLIMSVWATGQAVVDVRNLLKGKKVPFMHDSDSFSLTLTGLLSVADSGMDAAEEGSGTRGLCYSDYLKILLFFGMGSEAEYRCMDIIQLDLSKSQSDFRLERLIYALETEVHVYCGHVFTGLGLVSSAGEAPTGRYQLSVSTAYSY